MATAKPGDSVMVHYTGTLKDGTQFDASTDNAPLQFEIGKGRVIPGFEEAVVGMAPGETKRVTIGAEKAYGAHNRELVMEMRRSELPAELKPEVGKRLTIREKGSTAPLMVTVAEVSQSSVTLDANHSLAGKELTFDIKLLEII